MTDLRQRLIALATAPCVRTPGDLHDVQQIAIAAARMALEDAAAWSTMHTHPNVPEDGGDQYDRLARYSNETVRRYAQEIRRLAASLSTTKP